MTKVLLAIGDSWCSGAELQPGEHPYPDLIEKQLGFDQQIRLSRGGASNEHSLIWLQQYLEQEHQPDWDVTAIFHLTSPARTAHLPWDQTLNIHSDDKQAWNTEAKQYWMKWYTYFLSSEHTKFRASATISAMQAWCNKFGIKDYYFSGWINYKDLLTPGVDTSKIWAQGAETAADWFGASDHNGECLINVEANIYIQPNQSHPNQRGHQLIANKLASWIQNK